MVHARALALTKLLLDVTFLVCVVSVYFIDIFSYMNTYNIGMYQVVKKEDYLSSNMIKQIPILYSDFYSHFCIGNLPSNVKTICEHRQHFENAGILYLSFGSLALIFDIYSILGMLGIFCKCSNLGVLKLQFIHYVYPVVYATCVIIYFTVTRIFTLTTPKEFSGSEFEVKVRPGVVLMSIALAIGTLSGILFFFSRRKLRKYCNVAPTNYELNRKRGFK